MGGLTFLERGWDMGSEEWGWREERGGVRGEVWFVYKMNKKA